jgi:phage tail-like protein
MPDATTRIGWSEWRALAAMDFRRAVERGTPNGLLVGPDGRLTLAPGFLAAAVVCDPLDNGGEPRGWHRLVIDADIPRNASVTISFLLPDERTPEWTDGIPFTTAREAAIPDEVAGGGLTMRIELAREPGVQSPTLASVKAYLPRGAFLRYLPSVYAERDDRAAGGARFLERFLSAFEARVAGVGETISSIPSRFDPSSAPPDYVPWLASWLSLDLYEVMGERNRAFIARAWEFYREKGTVAGLASLVSFLTGKACSVKEFSTNVFRTFGVEHCEADEYVDARGVRRFFHKTSRTVNFADRSIVNNFGKLLDTVHYTVDAGEGQPYNPRMVGIFITLGVAEDLLIDEERLVRIIRTFLPVFMRARIIIVWESPEVCPLAPVQDAWRDRIAAVAEDTGRQVSGTYRDEPGWRWMRAYDGEPRRDTNDRGFRTPHTGMSIDCQA